jgi:methyl-accepting chemotaxis protein
VSGRRPTNDFRTALGANSEHKPGIDMLSQLSIRAKIIVSVSVLIMATVGMGVLSIWQMQAINARTVDIQSNWLQRVRLVGDLRAYTLMYRGLVRAHILANDAAGKAATDKNNELIFAAIDRSSKAYEAVIGSDEERTLYGEFQQAWTSYIGATQDILAASRKSDETRARDLHVNIAPAAIKADELLSRDVGLINKGPIRPGNLRQKPTIRHSRWSSSFSGLPLSSVFASEPT